MNMTEQKLSSNLGIEYTYEQVSTVLLGMISSRIVSFYDSKKRDNDFCSTLLDEIRVWLLEKEFFFDADVPEIERVIYYILDTELGEPDVSDDVSDALEHTRMLIRSRRQYLYRKIREEMGEIEISKQGSQFIETEWLAITNPALRNRPDMSREEFFQSRFEECTLWAQDSSNYRRGTGCGRGQEPYCRNFRRKFKPDASAGEQKRVEVSRTGERKR